MACARCSSPTPKAGCSTSSTSSDGARRRAGARSCRSPCAKAFQPHAQGDVAARTRLRGAEPVARNQGVRRRRRALHVPRRGVAPARSAGQVPPLGGGRRRRCARDADLSDGARSGGCAGRRAVRRSPRRSRQPCRNSLRQPTGSTAHEASVDHGSGPSRRDLLHLLEGRSITDLDPNVLAALASLDGAIVMDRAGRLLAAGAILRHPLDSRSGRERRCRRRANDRGVGCQSIRSRAQSQRGRHHHVLRWRTLWDI